MDGVLIVNKPEGWTSHDVVAKLRGLLRERRIGHGGTLDPMATGVLPLFVGRATRAAAFSENADKEYLAVLRLGVVTDTQDITGKVLSQSAHTAGLAELSEVLSYFTGEIDQLPPMYSAVKVNGKRLYEYARAGESAERKVRTVTISELVLLGEENGGYLLKITCSKGTYIRTLCNDIGQKLGCGGVMASLVRIRAGGFSLKDAHSLDELIAHEKPEELLMPVDSIFTAYEALTLDSDCEKKLRNGAPIKAGRTLGRFRLYSQSGAFLAIADTDADGFLRNVKKFS